MSLIKASVFLAAHLKPRMGRWGGCVCGGGGGGGVGVGGGVIFAHL